jgi:hypothetical protein
VVGIRANKKKLVDFWVSGFWIWDFEFSTVILVEMYEKEKSV